MDVPAAPRGLGPTTCLVFGWQRREVSQTMQSQNHGHSQCHVHGHSNVGTIGLQAAASIIFTRILFLFHQHRRPSYLLLSYICKVIAFPLYLKHHIWLPTVSSGGEETRHNGKQCSTRPKPIELSLTPEVYIMTLFHDLQKESSVSILFSSTNSSYIQSLPLGERNEQTCRYLGTVLSCVQL